MRPPSDAAQYDAHLSSTYQSLFRIHLRIFLPESPALRTGDIIAVRAISDQAHEALPVIMASFIDELGQTKMSAVLAALIFGRVGLGALLRAGGASRRAHQALLRCRGALAGLG